MHRQEVDAGADVLLGERTLVFVARGAGTDGSDADDVEVEGVPVARVALERSDPLEVGDGGVVGGDVALADGPVPADLAQLRQRDRGEHVGEVRLEAGGLDVVAGAVAAAHDAQRVDGGGDRGAVRGDDAALAAGDVLRGVQREAGRLGEAADLAAAVHRLDGVRSVLDDGQVERVQRVEVGGGAGEVHRHDRLRARAHQLGDALRIDRQVAGAHVGEDRRRARMDDHVRRGRPGDRRGDHLVAGPDAERDERQVQRRRAGGDGQCVLDAEVLLERGLELARLGAAGEPAGAQRRDDLVDLLVVDRGRLEAEERRSTLGRLGHRW